MTGALKKSAGIAQPSERRSSLPEGAGENPAPRSRLTQALAAGLQLDPAAKKLGAGDAAAGMFRLDVDDILGRTDESFDTLAYLRGWLEGRQAQRKRG